MVELSVECDRVGHEVLGTKEERPTMKSGILVTLALASGRGEAQATKALHHGRATRTETRPRKRRWHDTVEGTLR